MSAVGFGFEGDGAVVSAIPSSSPSSPNRSSFSAAGFALAGDGAVVSAAAVASSPKRSSSPPPPGEPWSPIPLEEPKRSSEWIYTVGKKNAKINSWK